MWYYNNDDQNILDRSLFGIFIFSKAILKIATYSPLIITGYTITSCFLDKKESAFAWIILVIVFSILVYLLIYFLKGLTIGFKLSGKWLWLPFFIVCVFYTSVIPVWICFETIQTLAAIISKTSGKILTPIVSACFGISCYSHYQLLTNSAPRFAFSIYKIGFNTAIGKF